MSSGTRFACLILTGLVVAADTPRAAPATKIDVAALAGADWTEVRTAHFAILTDATEGIALGVGRRLERFCVLLRTMHPGLRTFPALPTDVYVFRNEGEMGWFTPEGTESISGYSTAGPGRSLFVLNAEVEGTDRAYVVCHEFTHLFLGANFAGLPIWLNEGLAQYYQTFRLRGRKAEVGHPFYGPPEWLASHEWTSLTTLFAMNASAGAYQRDNELRDATYAQGWAIVHYLESDPGRAARFDSVLSAMRRGVPAGVAFRMQFPADQWEELGRDVHRYVQDGALEPRTVAMPDLAGEPEPRSRGITGATALMRLGDLMLALGPSRSDAARALYESAVTGDTSLAPAQAGLGVLADRAGDSTLAETDYSRAERLAPRDARVALLAAQGTLERAGRVSDRPDPAEDAFAACMLAARRRLAHCLEIEPANPEALGYFGITYISMGEAPDTALAGLSAAVDALPSYANLRKALEVARKLRAEGSAPAQPKRAPE